MEPSSAKAALRADLLARRRRRSRSEREAVGRHLADRIRALCTGAQVVAAYTSYGTEPGTGPAREVLRALGTTVLLPVVRGDRLGWAVDDGAEHARGGELGMPEPAAPVVGYGAPGLLDAGASVLLVPALAVSPAGVRLGRGGGYYDRLLATLPPYPDGPLRVAVVHDDEMLAAVPAEPHDLAARVDRVLTPTGLTSVRFD